MVGGFCLLAALRVGIFSAAFPFFADVDEQHHFDNICRYSHGEIPQGLQPYSPEAAALIAFYGTPEYLVDPQNTRAKRLAPPLWTCPDEVRTKIFTWMKNGYLQHVNHETVQPPFYYAVMGAWYDLGKLLGMEGGQLLYWVRFFNVPVYALLVWLSYVLTKDLFPASKFLYLGVPLLLVVLPQDVFYSLNNDVFSAPLVTLSLCLLVRMYRIDAARPGLAICAGLTAAAAVLTKFMNAPILVMVGVAAFLKLGLPWWRKQPLTHLVPVALLLAASIIPIACWLARNYFVLGELTGFALRNHFMTWTPKPFAEYWNHPIFTPHGFFLCFWGKLLGTFWQGEFSWHGARLAAGNMDVFYAVSSLLFLVVFFAGNVVRRGGANAETHLTAMLCSLMFAMSVAMLILFSISVDFGACNYPSREQPYITSGRLMLAALVPFLIMYLGGLEWLLDRLRMGFARLPALCILVGLMTISQIAYTAEVFASRYNWFHLP